MFGGKYLPPGFKNLSIKLKDLSHICVILRCPHTFGHTLHTLRYIITFKPLDLVWKAQSCYLSKHGRHKITTDAAQILFTFIFCF